MEKNKTTAKLAPFDKKSASCFQCVLIPDMKSSYYLKTKKSGEIKFKF